MVWIFTEESIITGKYPPLGTEGVAAPHHFNMQRSCLLKESGECYPFLIPAGEKKIGYFSGCQVVLNVSNAKQVLLEMKNGEGG